MKGNVMGGKPVVSVIITCYNQGNFLADAIRSVLSQSYAQHEIIVVDDGSTDDTRQVCASFPAVRYVHQSNSGLSSARNTGIDHSTGGYLVFLDADDFLYNTALESNLEFLLEDPALAFVSGHHDKVDEWGYPLSQETPEVVTRDHYKKFLQGNYVGMHGAVMYARWVFFEYRFDTSLKACEDYDLYLRISHRYKVASHDKKLAAYRFHDKNMSSNTVFMYHNVLKVLHRQEQFIQTRDEQIAWLTGIKNWKQYYGCRLFDQLWAEIDTEPSWPSRHALTVLLETQPGKFLTYLKKRGRQNIVGVAKTRLPHNLLRLLHNRGWFRNYLPQRGKVDTGDFKRLTPFSHDFGFDRGGAIDRFYIENFIRENQHQVRGNVLEIGDNEYTLKYGRHLVQRSEILHVDETNAQATYVGDITNVPQIPSEYFDCIIFTQTLHLIYDFKSALKTCYRILKPGGCLLLTVPGISNIDRGAWKDYWLWSFTDTAMRRVMKETFNGSAVDIGTYGNVHTASAFLYGMGLPEVSKDALVYNDPSYQVIVSVKAVKA